MAIIKYLCSLLIAFHSLSLSAKEINFIEIQPGMFVHQGSHFDVDIGYQGDICNVGFIIGNEAVAVIDTGGSLGVGNSILKEIKKEPTSLFATSLIHMSTWTIFMEMQLF